MNEKCVKLAVKYIFAHQIMGYLNWYFDFDRDIHGKNESMR